MFREVRAALDVALFSRECFCVACAAWGSQCRTIGPFMITEWLLISCPALANNPMDAGWGELTEEWKDTKVGGLGW